MDWFLRSYLRRHLMGKPVLSLQIIGCFFRLAFDMLSTFYRLKSQNYRFSTDLQMREKINFSLLVFTFGWARYNAYCPRNFLILSQVPCHILWIHLCSCHAFSQALFLPAPTETRWSELINIIQSRQNNTLGARDFSSAVSVFCQVFIVTRSWLRPTAEDVSAFGEHRKFPLHARKTSGTQGNKIKSE